MKLRVIIMAGVVAGLTIFFHGGRHGRTISIITSEVQAQDARNPSPAPNSPATPALPDVPKPDPAQPVTGLPSDDHLHKTPPRETKGLDLVKMDWSYNCMECHRIVEVKWHRDRTRVEHQDIVLNHGNNRFCLNCHNATNMNAFVDYDGSEIAEHDVVLLCAKCHGPTHRDWKAGVHGRRNGFWNAELGTQTRLRCIQCHDPHNPKFKAMEALPAPHYPRRAAGEAQPQPRKDH